MTVPDPAASRLLVINGYSLAIPGQGIGVYTVRLLRGLLRNLPTERIRVAIPEVLQNYAKDLPEDVVETIPGSPPRRGNQLLHDIYWASRTGAYLRSKYPSCVFHCPREFYAWTSPRDTITTIHDCNHWIFRSSRGSFARAWWRRATERFAARRSPIVLTVSDWARRDLITIARIPAEKIRVVYNWIDPAISRTFSLSALPEVRSRLGIPSRYFLYVGGFSANKNIDALLRAYAKACAAGPIPTLVAAGELGQYRHAHGRNLRETLRSLGLSESQVITPGFVPSADLPSLMAGADLLVYPSKSEGFGYPPVEAISLGTPVLVADATSMIEVVRNKGSRFSPDDENELAGKLGQAAASNAAFRCELAEEFTEAYGIRNYLRVMNEVGLGLELEPALVRRDA